MARPLRGGGVRAWPLRKNIVFGSSKKKLSGRATKKGRFIRIRT